jgi:electron transfer flavoprotein alpha subunit
MTTLVIAEHDHASLKSATLNAVTAAKACGGDVHVLVAGHNAAAAAQAASQVAGVAKVLHADGAALARDFRFEVIGDAGHYLPEESPKAVSRLLLNWLDGIGPRVT